MITIKFYDPGSIRAIKRDQSTVYQPRDGGVIPDGGFPSSAGIMPVDASDLDSFLDDYSDTAGFKLTYSDGGEEQTELLYDVSLIERTLDRPAAAPAIRCTPLPPGTDHFSVRVDAIELLSVVEPPPNEFTAGADTPGETATALRRLANAHPDAVDISSILTLLDRKDTDPQRQRDALRALRLVAAGRPEDCTPAIPILESYLGRDTLVAPVDALTVLREIGDTDPAAIAPLTDDVASYLEADTEPARREAIRCVAAIAEDNPGDALDTAPALATVIEDETDGQKHAVYALSRLTTEYPDEVKPHVETLTDVILDDSLSDTARMNATAALGRITEDHPSIAVDIVDDVVALLDDDNHKLRNNAIGLIGEVANLHTDVVEPHVDAIAGLLTVDDAYTRINATAALARVAEDFPGAVDHVTTTFIDLLSDDEPFVRENACWALGYLDAHEAEDALQERAYSDENEDVRTRAQWAVTQLSG